MIINESTNTILSQKEIFCKNILTQGHGLMFRRRQNLIMEFPRERPISLHMFFVFYPIDVIILNKHREVIEIKQNFKPFTFWKSKTHGKYVVEFGKNRIKNVKISDRIKIKE